MAGSKPLRAHARDYLIRGSFLWQSPPPTAGEGGRGHTPSPTSWGKAGMGESVHRAFFRHPPLRAPKKTLALHNMLFLLAPATSGREFPVHPLNRLLTDKYAPKTHGPSTICFF